jgi:hypothetical protein
MEASGEAADQNPHFVQSVGECKERCEQSLNCKIFSYSKSLRAEGRCYLYKRATFWANPLFDSGMRE